MGLAPEAGSSRTRELEAMLLLLSRGSGPRRGVRPAVLVLPAAADKELDRAVVAGLKMLLRLSGGPVPPGSELFRRLCLGVFWNSDSLILVETPTLTLLLPLLCLVLIERRGGVPLVLLLVLRLPTDPPLLVPLPLSLMPLPLVPLSSFRDTGSVASLLLLLLLRAASDDLVVPITNHWRLVNNNETCSIDTGTHSDSSQQTSFITRLSSDML